MFKELYAARRRPNVGFELRSAPQAECVGSIPITRYTYPYAFSVWLP
jgi:hypothetical protein